VVDIATQVPGALNHQRMDRKGEPVHEVRIAPDSLLARLTGRQTLGVNSTHHQSIGAVAPPLRAVAESSDGVIEAVELKEPQRLPFLLSVQFHPERLIDSNALFLQLFNSFVAACERRRQTNL
jgi:putative glutamine amidotransferase